MRLTEWLQSLLSSSSRRSQRRPRRRNFHTRVETFERRVLLTTFLVDSTADAGLGSFRQAIDDANANPGTDTIEFNITGSGVQTIELQTALPEITDTIIIDATTQTGFSGTPLVELDGTNAGTSADGLVLGAGSGGSTIRGLVINRFDRAGLQVESDGNIIVGNYIGLGATGTLGQGNLRNGVSITSANNLIGGTTIADRNIISGNGNAGISITGIHATGNRIQGNFLGTNAAGTSQVQNFGPGVAVDSAPDTVIGTDGDGVADASEGNLISGNSVGVYINNVASGAVIAGNLIGTDSTGSNLLANSGLAVHLRGGSGSRIGTNADGIGDLDERNMIVGGTVYIDSNGSQHTIAGNWLGYGVDESALSITTGITLDGAGSNTIGGDTPAERNVIAGRLTITSNNNFVHGNYLGLTPDGTSTVNSGSGVSVAGSNNQVGGAGPGQGNVIATASVGGNNNRFEGNRIGTNAVGTNGLGINANVFVVAGDENIIGTPTAGNVISSALNQTPAFHQHALIINGVDTIIQNNIIGLDPAGNQIIGNQSGIWIQHGASGTLIGGDGPNEGNVISGNTGPGIQITGGTGAVIQGNLIGTDVTGMLDRGNSIAGNNNAIQIITGGSSETVIGGPAPTARNVISGNEGSGIYLSEPFATVPTVIQNNFIGVAIDGMTPLGNSGNGITVADSTATIGGDAAGAGNVISSNAGDGIHLVGAGSGLPEGIVSWWRAEADAADLAGTNEGTLLNGVTFAAGQSGQAFRFDGVDDAIVTSATAVMNQLPLTLEAWVKPELRTDGINFPTNVISNDNPGFNGHGFGVNVFSSGSQMNVEYQNGFRSIPGVSFNAGDWYHVAVVYTPGRVKSYVNGRLVDDFSFSQQQPDDGAGFIRIGQHNNDAATYGTRRFFKGLIDEPAVYNRSLNDQEIAQLYAASGEAKRGSIIPGNIIGLDATGTFDLGNGGDGVEISNSPLNRIGGSSIEARNVISGNTGNGVLISGASAAGNAIRGNAIFANAGLGIDLNADGVTANDPVDGDTGPNGLQNFPVLSAALTVSTTATNVVGSFNSLPNSTYAVDFYANTTSDSSGHGEGERFLGTTTVTTDAAGNTYFNTVVGPSSVGEFITATLIAADGSTSEFSANTLIVRGPDASGRSLQFDGADDFVEIPNSPSLHSDRQLTVESWFKIDDLSHTAWQNIFHKGNYPDGSQPGFSDREYALWVNSAGYLHFSSTPTDRVRIGQLTVESPSGLVRSGEWHHFAGVIDADAGLMQLYLDGELVGSRTYNTAGIRSTNGPLRFVSDGYQTKGQLDEMRIWSTARTQQQIRANRHAQLTGNEAGLMGYWRFDEIAGDVVTDLSGNGNHGTFASPGVQQGVSGRYSDSTAYNFYKIAGGQGAEIATNVPEINTAAGGYNTVSFWMYWNGAQSVMPFGFTTYSLYLNGGAFGFNTGQGNVFGISSAGLANRWVHVTAAFANGDATQSRLWIDGVEQTMSDRLANATTASRTVTADARIAGWSNNGQYRFTGLLDEVALFNRPLSNAEIQAQFTADSASGYRAVLTGQSPIAHYALDEITGTTALDSSGNSHHGTILSGAPLNWGIPGAIAGDADTAVEFGEGIDQTIQLNPFEIPETTISVEVWIKTTATNASGIISYAVSGQSNEHLLYNPNNLEVYFNGPFVRTGVSVNDGLWHHVVVTWQSSNGSLRLYKDGALAFSTTHQAGVPISTGGSLVLGQDQDTLGGGFQSAQRYIGVLDEFAVYDRVLSASDVLAHYNAGINPLADYEGAVLGGNPVLFWRLGDPETGMAVDSSGNGHHGKIGSYPIRTTSTAPLYASAVGADEITLTVTNTLDAGPGSLRQAILDAHQLPHTNPVNIIFDIPQADSNFMDVDSGLPGGDLDPDVFVITPTEALPIFSRGNVTIDGRTQTETNPFGPEIVLDGSEVTGSGLAFYSSDNEVHGLNIHSFSENGVFLASGSGNWLSGNYMGIDATGRTNLAPSLRATTPVGAGTDAVFFERNGQVVVEAEDFQSRTSVGASNWLIVPDETSGVASFSNARGKYIQVLPDNVLFNGNSPPFGHSPAVRYTVHIDTPGDYRLFARFDGFDGGSDSLYASIIELRDGVGTGQADWYRLNHASDANFDTTAWDGVGEFEGTSASGNNTSAVWTIAQAGDYTVEFLSREDGIALDAFVLQLTSRPAPQTLGNVLDGVRIQGGGSGNVIGTNGDGTSDAAERNVIAANGRYGVYIVDPGTDHNVVAGNYIGTDAAGTSSLGNTVNGIRIDDRAAFNLVGTDSDGIADAAERNVISGNLAQGILLNRTTDNKIAGNYVGTDSTGTARLGNLSQGILLSNGSARNIIGTDGDGIGDSVEANVISASGTVGLYIANASHHNIAAGNFIGTDVTGTVDLGNGGVGGVRLFAGAYSNRIGTDFDGISDDLERNIISGNIRGVQIDQFGTTDNTIAGNYIGTDINGQSALANDLQGVRIADGAQRNIIDRNVISGNTQQGVLIQGTPTSTFPVFQWTSGPGANGHYYILAPSTNWVAAEELAVHMGGHLASVTNAEEQAFLESVLLPSGESFWLGFRDDADESHFTWSSGEPVTYTNWNSGQPDNWPFGTPTGEDFAAFNWGTPGKWNDFSDATRLRGVIELETAPDLDRLNELITTHDNHITGNYIGTTANGAAAIGNGGTTIDGVVISDRALANIIGTDGDGLNDQQEGNVISGNGWNGIAIYGTETRENVIAGNLVGTNAAGNVALGNGWDGINIQSPSNRVGTNGNGVSDDLERNTIAAGSASGIALWGPDATNNIVAGNFIGTDVTGTITDPDGISNSGDEFGSAADGVHIGNGAHHNLIGTNADGLVDSAERNIISGNLRAGVFIQSEGSTGNTLAGNFIGTDATGTVALGNVGSGVALVNAAGNFVGGPSAGQRNIISGNGQDGVTIDGNGGISRFRAEGSGNDSIGSNNGTVQGGTTFVPGVSGQAFNFDGTGYVQIPDNPSLNVSYLTMAGWIKPVFTGRPAADYDFDTIFTKGSGTGFGYSLAVVMDPTAGRFFQAPPAGVPIGTPAFFANIGGAAHQIFSPFALADDGQFHHVAGTFDGSTIRLFVDGVEVASKAVSGSIVSTNVDAFIGGQPESPAPFNILSRAAVDDVVLADHALSADQIERLFVERAGTLGNRIQGNYIGTDATGTQDLGNVFNGIQIRNGASGHVLGGTTSGARNIISGNDGSGVVLSGTATSNNVVAGNYIGTDWTGQLAIGNFHGLVIDQGANSNIIGTDGNGAGDAAKRNIISGNHSDGLVISGPGTSSNRVAGNFIGTDVTGASALGNANSGVRIDAGASSNIIGTNGDGTSDVLERNVISGNATGVQFSGADGNILAGNFIGTNSAGSAAFGNNVGVWVNNSNNIRIGSDANGQGDAAERNVISGNFEVGVDVSNASSDTTIAGNFIGLGADGNTIIGNGVGSTIGSGHGIWAYGAASNLTIGGTTAAERNIISGNTQTGIKLGDELPSSNATSASITGNYIGTDATGTLGRGNGDIGIHLADGDNVQIGAAGAGNVIAANGQAGITILAASTGAVIQGNRIGTDRTGTAALGNGQGIITHQAALIGTDSNAIQDAEERNILANSTESGVVIVGGSLTGGVTVSQNVIHTNGGLGIDFGNDGVTPNGSGLQDYPVLTTVVGGADTRVIGTVSGPASSTLILEFYADTSADPSGFGEGRRYLSSRSIVTNATGNASFDFTLTGISTVRGEFVAATATAPTGSTSEFSQAAETSFNQPPTITSENLIVTMIEDSEGGQTAAFGTVTTTVPENHDFRIDGLFESPDPEDVHTVTVDWGDGTSESVTVEAGVRGFSLEHRYDDDTLTGTPSDVFTAFITVTDSSGASGSASIPITVENVAPTIRGDLVLVPPAITEGQTVDLSGIIDDPGRFDTHTVTIDWGDGSPVASQFLAAGLTEFAFSHTYEDDNLSATPIVVTLTDDDGGMTVAETSLNVANVAPTAAILRAPVQVLEGDTVTLTAGVSDPGSADTHSYQWTASRAGLIIATGTSQTFDFVPPDSGDYTVSLSVNDDDGGVSGTQTLNLTVQNVAPVIVPQNVVFRDDGGSTVTGVTEGAPVRLDGSFADPGIEAHTITIDWGDGSSLEMLYLAAGVSNFAAEHIYSDDPNGSLDDYSVSIVVADADLDRDSTVLPITIGNVSPIARIVDNGSDSSTVRLAAVVTDDGADDFTYAWTVAGITLPPETPTDQPTFSFARPSDGVASVSLTVTDDDGSSTRTEILFVAGTDAADTITIAPTSDNPDGLSITVNTTGSAQEFDRVDAVLVSTGDGDDVLDVDPNVMTPLSVLAGAGNDSVTSGGGDDFLEGGEGDDTVRAGGGNDVITSIGNDDLAGETGNDTYLIQGFSDKILREDGGDGVDTINFAQVTEGVTLNLGITGTAQPATETNDMVTLFGDFENLVGSDYDDTFTGNDLDNVVDSGEGNDLLFDAGGNDSYTGGGGDDSIIGASGNDTLDAGMGNDSVVGGIGDETIFGGDGNDLIFDGAGNDSYSGGGGDDSITGGSGNDMLDGGTGNDSIAGGIGDETIFGGDGNDLIFDGAGNDSYAGGGGDDSIVGGTGNDTLDAGMGNDTVYAGGGDETIFGGEGNDLIFDGAGNDSYTGGGGDDSIYGGSGNDTLDGGTGNDSIIAGGGDETIFGGDGNDLIFDGAGNDSYAGGGGDDTIYGGSGNDTLDGGSGNDSIVSGLGDETIFGGEGNDLIFDGAGNDSYAGGGGDDTIYGGSGNDSTFSSGDDTIFGGEGNDLIFDGAGNDSYTGGAGNDTIYGGSGNDSTFSSGDDTIFGGDGNDLIFDGAGNDSYEGGGGNDTIYGGSGNDSTFSSGDDTIFGGEGNDLIFDGAGNDSYTGGSGNDTIYGGYGNDSTFSSGDDTIFGGDGNDLIFDGAGNDSYTGGSGNDTIYGGSGNDSIFSSGDDTIFGGDGNDLIFDGAGNDSYAGGGGDDTIYGGSGNDSSFSSGGDDTIFGGDGNDLIFDGEGNDSYTGGGGNDTIYGGSGGDTLDGDSGNDSIIGGGGEETLFGGEGNDLIFGGANSRLIDGGTGNDVILSGSEAGSQTQILGNAGSDTVVSGAGDETIAGGAGDEDWLIESSDSDMVLSDLRLTAQGTTTYSEIERFLLSGGDGDNLLDASAFSGDVLLIGGAGNDTLLGGAGNDTLNGGAGDDLLDGRAGDDTYQFDAQSNGNDTIAESASAGSDLLDFGSFSQSITVDLGITGTSQLTAGHLFLTFTDGASIENVVGTAYSDQIIGNSLDNKLFGGGGKDNLNGADGDDLVQANVTKWVFLDFDTHTEADEHIYTSEEREAIRQRMAEDFADFDFEFTLLRPAQGPFVTVLFNATPLINGIPQPGGRASQLGWRMVNLSGTVIIDVNGFLGGRNGLAPTSQNFIALSSTIAAHEVAHQFGLRHHDSFGALGDGISPKLNPERFLPEYPGLANADETRFHLLASPGSVGTSLVDAAGNPFFGERERIKLAFAETGTSINEADPTSTSLSLVIDGVTHSAQDLGELALLSVPIRGEDQTIAALNVAGRIELTEDEIAESDFYAIHGEAGDLLTVEILSASLDRLDESIDSVLRIYDASGQKLNYYGSVLGAFNDDNLELADSILLDVVLPEAGTYFVEVDTFRFRSPEFSTYLPDFDVESFERQFPLHPGVADNDVGDYELFLYRTSSALGSHEAGGDTLSGGAGADVLIGSSGRDEILGFNLLEDSLSDRGGAAMYISPGISIALDRTTLNEGESVLLTGSFSGISDATITIDWGDGSTSQFDRMNGTFSANHAYADDKPGTEADQFIVRVTVSDPQNLLEDLTAEAAVKVQNVAPQNVDAGKNRIQRVQGEQIDFAAQYNDVNPDTHTIAWNLIEPGGQSIQSGDGSTFAFTPADNGLYIVELTVLDDDGGKGTDRIEVFVQNAAPRNVNAGDDRIVSEGDLVSLTASFNDAQSDTHTYLWQVSASNGQVISDGHAVAFEFTPEQDGVYTVTVTVTDDEGASATDTVVITAVNFVPIVSIAGPDTGVRGQTRWFTFSVEDRGDSVFDYEIDWGDGTTPVRVMGAGANLEIAHTYESLGSYHVRASATDPYDATSDVADHNIEIRIVDIQNDLWSENASAVVVGGSHYNDSIDFLKLDENGITADIRTHGPSGIEVVTAYVRPVAGGIELTIDAGNSNLTVLHFANTGPIGRVIAFGQAGDDQIRVSSQLLLASVLDGGVGRDILVGGDAGNLLMGGDGDDLLFGGDGRDILIGGDGADRMLGQGQEDLLVGGFVNFDRLDRAIESIVRIWSDTTLEYAARVAALSDPTQIDGLIAGESVFNDDDRDILLGGHALDWYIGDEEEDHFNATLDEIFTGIDESILDI